MAITVDAGATTFKVTGTAASAEKVTDSLTKIKSVYWTGITTAGQLCELTDKNGGPIIIMTAEADGCTESHEINCSYDGIYCADMDSGTLYIYR